MGYLLIYRTPNGKIAAHPAVFDDAEEAARTCAVYLTPGAERLTFATEFATTVPGFVAEHPDGYAFRVVKADHTTDGAPITPGLKVRINGQWEGTVEPTQFMATGLMDPGLMDPGSRFHDGWYLVCKHGKPHNKYNGERMNTQAVAV